MGKCDIVLLLRVMYQTQEEDCNQPKMQTLSGWIPEQRSTEYKVHRGWKMLIMIGKLQLITDEKSKWKC